VKSIVEDQSSDLTDLIFIIDLPTMIYDFLHSLERDGCRDRFTSLEAAK
jgi:hypothetical protein